MKLEENNKPVIIRVNEDFIERMTQFWESIEELQSLSIEEDSEVPKWVENIKKHLDQTIYKHIEVVKASGSDPYRMGLALGATKKIEEVIAKSFERLGEQVNIEYSVPPSLKERFEMIQKKAADMIYPEGDLTGMRILAYGFLVEAYTNWDWVKAKELFRGISDGLGTMKESDDTWVSARMNTEILLHMYWNWETIENHIQTIAHLHNWLLKAFKKQQLGELKRLEKICSRINLTLAGVGRPKKKAKKLARKKIPTKRK